MRRPPIRPQVTAADGNVVLINGVVLINDGLLLCLVFLGNLGWMGAHEVLASLGALDLPIRVLLNARRVARGRYVHKSLN